MLVCLWLWHTLWVCVCCDAIGLVLLCRCNYSIHSVELILNGGHSLRQIGRFKWSIVSMWSEWESEQVRKGNEEEGEDAKQVPTILFFTHLLIAHDDLLRSKMTVCYYEFVRSHARTLIRSPINNNNSSTPAAAARKITRDITREKAQQKNRINCLRCVPRALDSM